MSAQSSMPRRRRKSGRKKSAAPFLKSPKLLLEWIGGIAAVLGILGFLLSVLPRLSVQVSDSLNPSNPMATVFTLTNEGYLPIHDVEAACGDPKIKTPGLTFDSDPGTRFVTPESKAQVLSSGHSMALPCGHLIGVHDAISAEEVIIVEYRPDWVFWRRTERFPWRAEKKSDGTWAWDSLPR